MNIWHRRFLYLQIVFLLSAALIQWFLPANKVYILSGMIAFFFAEFVVLEAQRTENPAAVYYKKSCLFACADMLSVMWFMVVFIMFVISMFSGKHLFNEQYNVFLFLYIALRKLYIVKNYSYEI